MSRYEDYIIRCCRTGRSTPEQIREQAVSREVKAYYEAEAKEQIPVHHEFVCCSEN